MDESGDDQRPRVLEVSGSGGNDGDISFSWWYLGGVARGETMEMKRRGEDKGSIWTIIQPGGEDALHKNAS